MDNEDAVATIEPIEEFTGDELADKPAGDGMPVGNQITPLISKRQVKTGTTGQEAAFDDDAALTIVWADFMRAANWLDNQSWIAEWQYTDYMYQSPNFDRDWRSQSGRTARISRFNIAKNRNTMSTQVRRGIFAEQTPFVLEGRGKLKDLKGPDGQPNTQLYLDAWTELLSVLSDRAELEYNMGLFIECQGLQGTAIANPGWEEKKVIRKTRVRKTRPKKIKEPLGTEKIVHTWESDKYKVREEEVVESWPYFEYRRLGTTFWDEGWRTPNRPDLSAVLKIDVDYVTFEDLRQMRDGGLDIYKGIPEDDELERFFLNTSESDAAPATQTAQRMEAQGTAVFHAAGENRIRSKNPFAKPFMMVTEWTRQRVMSVLDYDGRQKTIRNGTHMLDDHALGYTANWWNIDNSGYGFGIGRLNVGDQRMDQGVLNEVLKMIAYPMNAPLMYNSASGNAPTQNNIMGLGAMWGINSPNNDIHKEIMWLTPPTIPAEAWKIYELGKEGGEDLVGANSTAMQGNLGGNSSSAMRTAAGVNRVGSKADENVADPIHNCEGVLQRWYQFLVMMVLEQMPPKEIREILSDKFGEAIVAMIDPEILLNAKFNIKILVGAKLAAKAAIAQLIPFMLQIVQQPQLMDYLHQKGWTINFKAIEDKFVAMSELAGSEDIFIPLTDTEKQSVAQANPAAIKAQIAELLEKLKGQNKLQEIGAKGQQETQKLVLDKTLDHISGDVPLNLAAGRLDRNVDMGELQNGIPTTGTI